ncbi:MULTISPECIES: hypothetical protein [unclassified Cryobacterium]|uniref:hypothetical protein n=1 Tax=unclassified Cryobacterium TaxID=2649013 RepID=UPI00141ACB87|nr:MULTISPECIES: hypothetical protein [unclassified Cryobacterium]MDY7529616.1 hypothetical protein [Cryobacterium sp. 10C2]MEB0288721.1 hypothetical protein [Cryobacterium sp. 10S3]MEB0292539.1 hypothetical protein [Cryobacterium sp. 10C2]WPX13413.1 hypothetical protein RHM57_17365 [Cryobacterium sp. 10S3]
MSGGIRSRTTGLPASPGRADAATRPDPGGRRSGRELPFYRALSTGTATLAGVPSW